MNTLSFACPPKKIVWPYPLLAVCLLTLSACSSTQKVKLDSASVNCGLLGPDCSSRLVPGGDDQVGMRNIKPGVNWTQYKKVILSPVTFWGGDSTKVPVADQQALVNYFDQELLEQLGKNFTLVSEPGPGVLKLDVALTDAETAIPVLRSISILIPQAHAVSNLKYLATGTYPFVGGAQVEIRATDSVTGEVLGEGLDKRIGGGSFKTGLQWQWGDAENAIDLWSEVLSKRLAAWTSGTDKP
ncbi:DUF3313 domain-containing protein [Methylomonas paludis]|uniref:DUF3313 domain-containing protein n=1 Tax=Methylomonas paludis TaxID=1173101 RepID=A0A975MQJ4_9GAMM|nr:DUF3313 domain-containing protein [Methylomonas paludis]QWF72085.1 DUF3313 domain-containing protein [Methylomonas paludis]